LDRGRNTEEEVEQVLSRDVEGVVGLQVEVGMAWLTDGLLNWQDIFRPLVEAWGGLSLGGLKRWFDNNTFFREPIISSELEPGKLSTRYLLTSFLPAGRPWKAVLPGPYTFIDQAEDRHYSRREDALIAVAEGLAEVCHGLEELGFSQVQFSEPSLAVRPPDEDLLETVREAYRALRRATGLEMALHIFFGPFQRLLPDLLDLPVDILGLDLYEEGLDGLGDHDFDAVLACGCVDARNSLLESPEEISRVAEEALHKLNPKDIILCPNADLEFLPRTVAEEKVRALGLALKVVREVV
jgi:5-methyltetrahydropteroyltriglutamate--homocysteine methyltransferase